MRPLKNPWGKVRRGYEMIIELRSRQGLRAGRGQKAAEAKAAMRGCLTGVQDLEIARLKRELRGGR